MSWQSVKGQKMVKVKLCEVCLKTDIYDFVNKILAH